MSKRSDIIAACVFVFVGVLFGLKPNFARLFPVASAATAAVEVPVESSKPVDFALDRVRHEFGELPEGKTYTTTFTVTSTGVSPLVLIDATTGCKCTKASFPKKPLRKGEKAVITVHFEATERGFFDKQILVRTNAAEKMVFRISGNVKK